MFIRGSQSLTTCSLVPSRERHWVPRSNRLMRTWVPAKTVVLVGQHDSSFIPAHFLVTKRAEKALLDQPCRPPWNRNSRILLKPAGVTLSTICDKVQHRRTPPAAPAGVLGVASWLMFSCSLASDRNGCSRARVELLRSGSVFRCSQWSTRFSVFARIINVEKLMPLGSKGWLMLAVWMIHCTSFSLAVRNTGIRNGHRF